MSQLLLQLVTFEPSLLKDSLAVTVPLVSDLELVNFGFKQLLKPLLLQLQISQIIPQLILLCQALSVQLSGRVQSFLQLANPLVLLVFYIVLIGLLLVDH